jgi:hypothetical protein
MPNSVRRALAAGSPGREFTGSSWRPPANLYPPIDQQAVLLRDCPPAAPSPSCKARKRVPSSALTATIRPDVQRSRPHRPRDYAEAALTSARSLLLFCTPLAWWLTRTRWRSFLLEALIALPLVLPPRCSAFTCCLRWDQARWAGSCSRWRGRRWFTNFTGLVVGSFIYSCPSQPPQDAFAAVGRRPLRSPRPCAPRRWTVSSRSPPLARRFFTAAVLGLFTRW